ncbi:hypothetical protein QU38_01405, partial [Staphylococcus aureus]
GEDIADMAVHQPLIVEPLQQQRPRGQKRAVQDDALPHGGLNPASASRSTHSRAEWNGNRAAAPVPRQCASAPPEARRVGTRGSRSAT